MSDRYETVEQLLEVHEEIAGALANACHALVAGRDAAHRSWLHHLDVLLRWHIGAEDELLLPEYAAREAAIPRLGRPDVIMGEHQLISRRLDAARRPGLRAAEALSGLSRLRHLLEHHDEREAQTFKVALDRLLPAELRRQLLDRIRRARPLELDRPPASVPLPSLVECAAPDPPPGPLGPVLVLMDLLATGRACAPRGLADAFHGALAALEPPADDERLGALVAGQQRKLGRVFDLALVRLAEGKPLEAFDRLLTVRTALEGLLSRLAEAV